LLVALAVSLFCATVVALPARAAGYVPGTVRSHLSWSAVDGVGLRWLPPAVTATAGAATGYQVWRTVPQSSMIRYEQLATVAGPGPDGWVRYQDHSSTSHSGYRVVAVNEAGAGPVRDIGWVVPDAPMPDGEPFDAAYAHNRSAAALLGAVDGVPPVGGTMDEITFTARRPITGGPSGASAPTPGG
jgi:hypothetical protein